MEAVFKEAIQDETKLNALVDTLIQLGDENNDKLLNFEEFKKMIQNVCLIYKLQAPSDAEIQSAFANIDADRSHALSKEEIVQALKNVFGKK